MTALITIASIIGALIIITWVLGIILFFKKKKEFDDFDKKIEADRLKQRKDFDEKKKQFDERFENFRNRNK